MGNICSLEELLAQRECYRRDGKRVVWTNGCFDLLHAGHLQSLKLARDFGDVLIVGLNADSSVRSLKDPDRPFVREQDRAALISGLETVDHVFVFAEKRCDRLLAAVKPDVYVKGAAALCSGRGAIGCPYCRRAFYGFCQVIDYG